LYQTVDGNPFLGTAANHGLLQDFPQLLPPGTPTAGCATTTQVGPGAGSDVGRVACGLGVVRARTNGAFSDYNALQTEFRANNLFKQLTLRASYAFSKNLDNTSEIFSAAQGAGNTLFAAQNPFSTGDAERSISGLDIPQAFTIAFTETLPFLKEQHGLLGHILGGWEFSGAYVYGSGQPFTARQGGVFTNVNSKVSATGNYFDTNYVTAFVGDGARPFYGNPNAPAGNVGIFCGDLIPLGIGATNATCLALGGNTTLLSFNALNAPGATDPRGCLRGTLACQLVPISQNDVRFIINMHTAQQVFGTPFGNVARNTLRDAISNRLDASIFKNIKIGERSNFELRLSAANALNHFNFRNVDPNMEDAGLGAPGAAQSLFGVGFDRPEQTPSTGLGFFTSGGRIVTISGKFTF
jgi:hypothetical protein